MPAGIDPRMRRWHSRATKEIPVTASLQARRHPA